MIYYSKDFDGDSKFFLKVAVSRKQCEPGTIRNEPKITPELHTERAFE